MGFTVYTLHWLLQHIPLTVKLWHQSRSWKISSKLAHSGAKKNSVNRIEIAFKRHRKAFRASNLYLSHLLFGFSIRVTAQPQIFNPKKRIKQELCWLSNPETQQALLLSRTLTNYTPTLSRERIEEPKLAWILVLQPLDEMITSGQGSTKRQRRSSSTKNRISSSSEQIAREIGHEQALTFDQDILDSGKKFLQKVKSRFSDRPSVYRTFHAIILSYRNNLIDEEQATVRALAILSVHQDLVRDFNKFFVRKRLRME